MIKEFISVVLSLKHSTTYQSHAISFHSGFIYKALESLGPNLAPYFSNLLNLVRLNAENVEEEIPKSQMKKLQKEYNNQKKKHETWLKKNQA